eukprot:GHVU01228335.1.p1 GENE.GHVU01228335.1~~GHVU01228335.1.p1  ORF type:complete len:180 (+),score=33.79 GHVU01228335.1:294-833(+)
MSSKRVSFGSNNGSMVETMIIDDTMPAEEQDPYQQQNGQVVVQKTTVEHVERKEDSTESHDNPFVKGSEIYQKADSILEHSIISRTQLSIYDPDQIQLEEMCKAETSPEAQSAPSDPNRSPNKNEINKTNGNVEDPLTAQKVEPTETGKANASQPEAKEPEEVKGGKDKNKKCKCCVVM